MVKAYVVCEYRDSNPGMKFEAVYTSFNMETAFARAVTLAKELAVSTLLLIPAWHTNRSMINMIERCMILFPELVG